MAKSTSFFGLRKGSTKSQTYSVLRGQQITKDRVSEVANPKTTSQMQQRALFATAVKFYKHANQRFFRFAFEDKKRTESEYNAFMRHNLPNSTIYDYAQSQREQFPAIGDGWVLTSGSLASPIVSLTGNRVRLAVGSVEGSETSFGVVCDKIIKAYGLQAGDIMTIVGVRSIVQFIDEEPSTNPSWDMLQFTLDSSSTAQLPDLVSVADGYVTFEVDVFGDDACGGAVVFSRNIAGSGVKVSTSRLVNNSVAQSILDASRSDAYRGQALNSWGATGVAILQGSITQNPAGDIRVATIDGSASIPYVGGAATFEDNIFTLSFTDSSYEIDDADFRSDNASVVLGADVTDNHKLNVDCTSVPAGTTFSIFFKSQKIATLVTYGE